MKNSSQMITARQGNRIMILEIFSAAAMFLPQIALQKSYHSGIVVVVMASVMAGIYLWIVDHAARGVSIENVLKRYRFAAIIYYVRFLLNGAFFYLCILSLTKKYLLPDKSTFFIGFPLLLLAYLINQGGLTKRGRVMEGIFWFVLLPLIFVLILSMANLSWEELVWQRDAQWKYSCICADASDRVRVVLPWRYERWTDQDAIICRFDDPFSWGVCKYCRFPWKEAYDGRSRTCDVYGTGSGNARRDHGKTGSFFDRILDRRCLLCIQRLLILWK